MNTEVRRKDRAITDPKDILSIVDKAKVLKLALYDGEYPYIVPLHFGYEFNEESGQFTFYMHGAKEGYKYEVIEKNPKACVELDINSEIIEAGDVPCAYGAKFASVIARGDASIVTDVEEKIKALTLLMRNQVNREFQFEEKHTMAVSVIKFESVVVTAKARTKK